MVARSMISLMAVDVSWPSTAIGAPGSADDQEHRLQSAVKVAPSPARRRTAEEAHRAGIGQIDVPPLERAACRLRAFARARKGGAHAVGGRICSFAEQPGIAPTLKIGRDDLARLSAFQIGERQFIARMDV